MFLPKLRPPCEAMPEQRKSCLKRLIYFAGEKDQGCKMISGVQEQYPKANQSVLQKAKYEEKKFECKKENS